MAAFSALTGLALTVVPPGRASVLAYSTPIWVVPLAAWRLKESPPRTALLGVALGLLGSLIIARPSIEPGRAGQLVGYAMLMVAAACWAISIVYVRGHRFVGTPLELAPWQMLAASLLLLPTGRLLEGPLQPIGSEGVMALAYVGPFATAFAYWAMVEVGRHFAASSVSMALLAVPCLGIAFSALTLGEQVNGALLVGIVLIGLGIGLTTSSRFRGSGSAPA